MSRPASRNCANCGALLADAGACALCGKSADRAAPIRDEHCATEFELSLPESDEPPIQIVARAPLGETPICPRCDRALVFETVGGLHTHGCAACGGVFLEGPSFQALERASESWPLLGAFGDRLARTTTVQIDGRALGYLSCPACRQSLARKNYLGYSGVIVDFCFRHGTWFDGGELAQAVTFLSAGGDVTARQKKASEQAYLEKHRRELKAPGPNDRTRGRGILDDGDFDLFG